MLTISVVWKQLQLIRCSTAASAIRHMLRATVWVPLSDAAEQFIHLTTEHSKNPAVSIYSKFETATTKAFIPEDSLYAVRSWSSTTGGFQFSHFIQWHSRPLHVFYHPINTVRQRYRGFPLRHKYLEIEILSNLGYSGQLQNVKIRWVFFRQNNIFWN